MLAIHGVAVPVEPVVCDMVGVRGGVVVGSTVVIVGVTVEMTGCDMLLIEVVDGCATLVPA